MNTMICLKFLLFSVLLASISASRFGQRVSHPGGEIYGHRRPGRHDNHPAPRHFPGMMRRISNTSQCEAVDGICSVETDCDLADNLFLGSCDSDDHGCCISKLHVCSAKNGTCMSAAECEGNAGHHASRMACSLDSVCCVPDMPFSRYALMHRRHPERSGPPPPDCPMRISNTTQCEAAGGSCSLADDCDETSNVFHGSCDDDTFGCCVSKDNVCRMKNGTCMSAGECEDKNDYFKSWLTCSDGICCVPKNSSRRHGRMFHGGERPYYHGDSQGGRSYHGRRKTRVSNTAMCDTAGGVCSTAANCDSSSSVIHGRCDDADLGCCIAKDDLCTAKNGTCQANCDDTPDTHASRTACSDGVCCVPNTPFAPCRGPMCSGFRGNRPGRQHGPRMMLISNSMQCVAYGGECALPADCADSSVLFNGSCGENDQGCCITKDDLCVARNGTCVTSEECDGYEKKHASRMACSDNVCCVPNRAFPRRFGDCEMGMDAHRVGAGRPWNRPGHGRPSNYPGDRHRDRRPDGNRRDRRPDGDHRDRRPDGDRRDRRPHGDRGSRHQRRPHGDRGNQDLNGDGSRRR